MKKPAVVYDESWSINEAYEASKTHDKLLCPHCNAEVVVVLDGESAKKHHVHPGIYCSRNSKHIGIVVELR